MRIGSLGNENAMGAKNGVKEAKVGISAQGGNVAVLCIIKADRGQLVVREVTRAERAEEPHGFEMEQIAVEEILCHTDRQIADKAGEDDRPDAR